MSKTLFMIHGMWGGAWYWQNYRRYFESKGYRTVAVDLPYHGCGIKKPDPNLGNTGVMDYLYFLIKEINKLDEKPIVIGHSMGGLLAQMLAERQLAEKTVLLCPAPPAGIIAMRPSILKTFLPVTFIPRFWRKPIPCNYSSAKYSVLNMMEDEEECREIVDKMGFESGRVLFEIGCWAWDKHHTTRVVAQNVTNPMLIFAASNDNIMPASVVFDTWQKYRHCAEYFTLHGHGHWVVAEPGWEKICDKIDHWIQTS